MPRLALIHTVPALIPLFRPLVEQAMPGWQSYNVADESLLQDTIRDGAVGPATIRRLTGYVFGAAEAGADAIVVTCSTLGGIVDAIRPLLPTPLFRIDRGMALAAIGQGERIGVLATLPTTLEPTSCLVGEAARAAGRSCTVVERLCAGAFQTLMAGDRAGHDKAIRAAFTELAATVDVVVLAQASMAGALAGEMRDTAVPVLSSPELGIAYVAAQLGAIS
ncbi:aspartate/glutamate racemase family protein [Ancylobacter sp. 6x-1]|uniref:Aspartate/glutamate racemase family protein n=1 Tax=Ancylobacter crimeensis TaxID=2579147 RepID=A0ABT0DB92_9HYPH|nr:aspartate/glutamate racemase family protein [Ancylobacter crimeensis]MCK0197235.1 aspartate/glutamate racemase family protein [Ancylobacter crimeensis]